MSRSPLPNGETRRSLAVCVLELSDSQSRAFFFETDSSFHFFELISITIIEAIHALHGYEHDGTKKKSSGDEL